MAECGEYQEPQIPRLKPVAHCKGIDHSGTLEILFLGYG